MVKKIGASGLVVFLLSFATAGSGYASENQVSGVAALVASEPAGYLFVFAAGLTLVVVRRWMSRKKNLIKRVCKGNSVNTGG